jgi:hypothetical protein
LDRLEPFVTVLMLLFDSLEVSDKRLFDSGGKDRIAILITITLAASNDYLVPGNVNVFDSQAAALHQSQSSSIEEHRHHPWDPCHATENSSYFLF